MEKEQKKKDVYANWWSTIVYPESVEISHVIACDKKWMLPMWVSPLHDNDSTDEGEIKKSHYHVVFKTTNTVSRSYVEKTFVATMRGVGCEKVHNHIGMLRYLCHLDNPEKSQYSPSGVIELCTIGFSSYIDLIAEKTDSRSTGAIVVDYIYHENIASFAALVKQFRDLHRIDELNYCLGHAYALNILIKQMDGGDF